VSTLFYLLTRILFDKRLEGQQTEVGSGNLRLTTVGSFNSSKMKQQRFVPLSMVVLFLFLSSERWIPTVAAIPFQIPNYGRWQVPTIGQVWPKPQQQTSRDDFFILTPSTFHFEVI